MVVATSVIGCPEHNCQHLAPSDMPSQHHCVDCTQQQPPSELSLCQLLLLAALCTPTYRPPVLLVPCLHAVWPNLSCCCCCCSTAWVLHPPPTVRAGWCFINA